MSLFLRAGAIGMALIAVPALAQATRPSFDMPSAMLSPPMTIPNGDILRNTGKPLAAKHQLEILRKAALSQRAADGGTLTPAHRIAFQKRIDRLEHVYGVTFRTAAD